MGDELLPVQQEMWDKLLSNENYLILKARQLGMTTVVAMNLFLKTFCSDEPRVTAIIAHKQQASDSILKFYRDFYFSIVNYVQTKEFKARTDFHEDPEQNALIIKTIIKFLSLRKLTVDKKSEMVFELYDISGMKQGESQILSVSSESRGGVRSLSVNYVHLSEFAFQAGADELLNTITPALHNPKQIIVESTANYINDPLYNLMKVVEEDPDAEYNFLFYPWTVEPNYKVDKVPNSFEYSDDELLLKKKYKLTRAQLLWRRKKIKLMGNDVDRFAREFPMTADEAYEHIGNSYFNVKNLKEIEELDSVEDAVCTYSAVDKKRKYVIGVDCAYGGGGDYSCYYVMTESHEIVEVYYSNKKSIEEFAYYITEAHRKYNEAMINLERNGPGEALYAYLSKEPNLLKWKDFITFGDNGVQSLWLTTRKTKVELMERVRTNINNFETPKLDTRLIEELPRFIINKKGNIDYPSTTVSHGDNVIAFGLALIAADTLKPYNAALNKDKRNPFGISEKDLFGDSEITIVPYI